MGVDVAVEKKGLFGQQIELIVGHAMNMDLCHHTPGFSTAAR